MAVHLTTNTNVMGNFGKLAQTTQEKIENKFEWLGYIVVRVLIHSFFSFIVFQMALNFIETVLLTAIRFIVELLLGVLMHLQR